MDAMLKLRINGRVRLYKRITEATEIPYIVELWKDVLKGTMFKTDKWEIYYIIKSKV